MSRYTISPSASRDLSAIVDYFASTNVEAGERFLASFARKCQNLIEFPMIGRSYDEIRTELRGVPLKKYIIFYRITTNGLEIVRVVHGSRKLELLFESEDDDV